MTDQLSQQFATLKAKGVHEFPMILMAEFSNPDRDWNINFFAIGEDPEDFFWASEFVVMAANEVPYERCKWVDSCGMHFDSEPDDEDARDDILLSSDSEEMEDGTFSNCWEVFILTPLEEQFWERFANLHVVEWAENRVEQLSSVCEWAREFPNAAQLILEQMPRTAAMDTPGIQAAVAKFARAIRQGLVA